MKLTVTERWIVANQYRILEALYPDEAKYYAEAREALEDGYELHYRWISQHISDKPMSEEECQEVTNILEMFWRLQIAYDAVGDQSGVEARKVEFPGFDGNYEARQLVYAKYYCRADDGRFKELRRPHDFNSHAPLLNHYRKMLVAWERSANKHDLTRDDLIRIASV